jgi:hypothetical protein
MDDKDKVSTKLLSARGDELYRARKTAMVKAWREWLHGIIAAMNEQRVHEDLEADMVFTSELGALIDEFEHCIHVRDVLMGPPPEGSDEQ